MEHPYPHTWEYCAAMAESSGLETFLYAGTADGCRIVCPLSVRRKEPEAPELVSPYGFGGIVTAGGPGSSGMVRDEWNRFLNDNRFVTAYVMQNPCFPLPVDCWGGDVEAHHPVYLMDLTLSTEQLWEAMCKTHRYELRRWEKNPKGNIVTDRGRLKKAIAVLYPETVKRVGASSVYDFAGKTLDALADARGSLLVGVEDETGIPAVAVFLYTSCVAEYFVNASSPEGRKYTRVMVWTALKMLKDLGVQRLNMGGGVKPGDSLDDFKRRFGGRQVCGQVLKKVIRPSRYERLCEKYCRGDYASAGYFPPYWRNEADRSE
jgi:hypothetical protein